SPHFSLHFSPQHAASAPPATKLSTGVEQMRHPVVDERPASPMPAAWRLGLVVPKRHARRAVTRNLIKRQGRQAFVQALPVLPAGDWLLRLRAPFSSSSGKDATDSAYKSAASVALKRAVGQELAGLFGSLPAKTASAAR
ncbi:MAG TPA: ribonuclease P protein component, partial [Methylibium sp.]